MKGSVLNFNEKQRNISFSTENCPSTYKRLGLTRYILFLTILVSDN